MQDINNQKLSAANSTVAIGSAGFSIGGGQPLAFICGPCVIENRDHVMFMAENLAAIARELGIKLIFKSSYDKANRTSASSYRGLGLEQGLEILSAVRTEHNLPVITDVHSEAEALAAGEVVDILQIPAFLCRQTDLLAAAARSGKPVMVKKGQFVHPADMKFAVEKIADSRSASEEDAKVLLCERGTCFGYRELVVDFRSLAIMRSLGCPVVFDATHSVQVMGGSSGKSSGNREYVPMLARAAVAAGVDAIFLECHDNPDNAPSDGPNMIPLNRLRPLLEDLKILSELKLRTRGNQG